MKDIIQNLAEPNKKYRPLPFWSWNDKLDVDNIRHQITEMKNAGLGGYFMHARSGLETEYLSNDWMLAIEAGLEEAEKLDMEAWVYDEDGWPSGFAGGKVCELGDEYHGRWLEKEVRTLTNEDLDFYNSEKKSSILGIYALSKNKKEFTTIDRLSATEAIKNKTPYLVITHNSNAYYIDVLSEKVVGKFIEFTHEEYKKQFPNKFNGNFKGFFTDEPRLSGKGIDTDFPWSYVIPLEFKSLYNQEIEDYLPCLFYPCKNYREVRYKFWKLTNKLFVNSFIKQIGSWCKTNNCKLTGHIMMEETISTQMPNTGGVMPFYEHMDIPGIDWLRRTMSSPIVPKQVSSVAAQTGKKQVLTESFALCGWNASFEDLKWVAQWQYVNGVNLLCQHLEGYTIRGMRKRDYPPSLFIQQPWWDQYSLFNTYFARLGLILSEGINPVDILVIHPIRSGWILFDGSQNKEINNFDNKFAKLAKTLSGLHKEYHLGDETIIERHGVISNNNFIVGKCSYKTVIIPETLTLGTKTLDLLGEFIKNGGNVIAINKFPSFENGNTNNREIINNPNIHITNLKKIHKLNLVFKNGIQLIDKKTGSEAKELQVTNRIFENNSFWYIVNNSKTKSFKIKATIPNSNKVYLYNPVQDTYKELEVLTSNGDVLLDLNFEPTRSMLLLTGDVPKKSIIQNKLEHKELIQTLPNWNLELKDPNTLLMDKCRYKIDNNEWEDEIDVIHLFKKLLERKKSCHISMEFTFYCELEKNNLTDLNLIIEQGEEFNIHVNGSKVECNGKDWWKDTSFKKTDILDKLIKGENKIILEREFYQSADVYRILYGEGIYETEKNKMTYDVELENIYLTGDFGVKSKSSFSKSGNNSISTKGPFVLTTLDKNIKDLELTKNGLMFFAGKVLLEQSISVVFQENTQYILALGKPNAAMVKVLVNNKEVTNLLWAPWEADLTEHLKNGENKLTLIIYGGNRNMLGPHHHIDGEPFNVGPGSFTGEWSWVEKKSEAIPATAADKKRNYWDKRYAVVPFGLN